MKPILGWAKTNLVSVIAIVVALAAFPTLFVLSKGRQASLVRTVEQEVGQSLRDLNGLTVTYEAPQLDPSAPPVRVSMTPNEAANRAVAEWIEAVSAEAQRLFDFVVSLNAGGRAPLVDGLFPAPAQAESNAKRLEMARRWPDAARSLIDRIGAGAPPPAEAVFQQLLARYESEKERILGIGAGESASLSAEDDARTRERLGAERLAAYRRRADEVLFYASPDAIRGVDRWDETRGAPSLEQCYEWQWRLWILGDVLEALAAANTDQAGQPYSASTGPVKRLLSLEAPAWDLPALAAGASGQPPARANLSAEIPRDFEISPTGRAGWPDHPGSFYDVRYADLSLLVDSSRLAEVIDAFPRTGLMSVVSLNIADYDPTADLHEGHYYGDGHLVRVSMRVETVWARPWTARYMPDSIRALMGVPDEWAEPADAPAAGQRAPQEASP